MVGVAAFADAKKQYSVAIIDPRWPLKQGKSCCFADRHAAAVSIKGPTGLARHDVERLEAVEGRGAKRVCATNYRGIADPGSDHAGSIGENLSGSRACRRNYECRAGEVQVIAHEPGHGVSVKSSRIVELRRQLAVPPINVPIGRLGLENPRGACSQENANT